MSTLQIDFAQAMSDFKIMFPDMDRDVIEAVLRSNQGAVDATIDQLLAMSTDNQNEKLRNELDKPGGATTLPETKIEKEELLIDTRELPDIILIDTSGTSQSPHLPELVNNSSQPNHNAGASPKKPVNSQMPGDDIFSSATSTSSSSPTKVPTEKQSKWQPPLLGPLPPGFLRITTPDGGTIRQDLELPDEQFALMLQNEEFMNELRWNQEFMTALEKEQQVGKSRNEVDDAAFKERLRHMGKVSRKKFLQMAKVFTWQRRNKSHKTTSAKQIDSLPLKEEHSDDEEQKK